jgi:site-specific DNA-methyltransferase (adenine-specific)
MRVETIAEATLYLGDCRDVMPAIGTADALVTDPPYGVGFKYASHDDRPEAYEGGYGNWLMERIAAAESALSPGAPVFVWQSGKNMRQFSAWFDRDWRLFVAAKNFVQMRPTAMQWTYDPVIVWWTPGARPWGAATRARDFHVANTAPVIGQGRNIEKSHPCPRPLDQVKHVIEQWCRPRSTVLDIFMGSGTTGVACAALGRSFVGIESDAGYFDLACRRIEMADRNRDLFVQTTPPATMEMFGP